MVQGVISRSGNGVARVAIVDEQDPDGVHPRLHDLERYSSVMSAEDVVRSLWDRIDARDWPGLAGLLDEDVVVEWPASRELILGRENFVAVQSKYPEGWSIRVLRILSEGDEVVSEVEVPCQDVGIFRVMSTWTVTEGKVTRAREYWTLVGADERPLWRETLTTLVPAVEMGLL